MLLTFVGLLAAQAHCISHEDDHQADASTHCAVHCNCQVLPEIVTPIVVASPLQTETTQTIPACGMVSALVVIPFFQPPRA